MTETVGQATSNTQEIDMKNLARKYRPTKLEDLLGQDALVTAMRAAFENDRVAQAYILTGVRGVGKTTTARIIARSVNCAQGPTLSPCGVCQSCQEIASDSSLDVYELDAASRTGVDAMRELIENIAYAPMAPGARKIYIIDEAHMLSTQAWNALLKTLEEPPEHVIFIFATTEPRKIPATIQSRCQKFSLRRIDQATISAHLSNIARQEGADLEAGVADIIAQAGAGSMRDALSILDQAISGNGLNSVSADNVRAMIGRATPKAMIDVLAAIAAGKAPEAIRRWRSVMDSGIDPIVGLDDLMQLIHQACLSQHDVNLLGDSGLSEEQSQRLVKMALALGLPKFMMTQKFLFDARPLVIDNPARDQAAEIVILRMASALGQVKA